MPAAVPPPRRPTPSASSLSSAVAAAGQQQQQQQQQKFVASAAVMLLGSRFVYMQSTTSHWPKARRSQAELAFSFLPVSLFLLAFSYSTENLQHGIATRSTVIWLKAKLLLVSIRQVAAAICNYVLAGVRPPNLLFSWAPGAPI